MPLDSPAAFLEKTLLRAWTRRGWLACLAWPVAQLFNIVIRLRAFLYRIGWLPQHKLAVPVIVVGNIFVGGTGKTPFTLWLVEQLKIAGYNPGVISRGYGSSQSTTPCVVTPQAQATEVGDEAVLMAQQSACPVVVARNRVEAGRILLSSFPEVSVIIADDGLQHLALARDIEIILFDVRGVGNGWLLPAGPLREPVTRQRDITVVNLNAGEKISAVLPADTVRMQLTGTWVYRLSDAGYKQELSKLDPAVNIVAAAGTGYPERFFTMLRQQGLRFISLPLPDHFNYASNPFKDLSAEIILITEKDAVKCRQSKEIVADSRIWVVVAEVKMDDGVMKKILKKLMESGEKRGSSFA